jgi:hypothetical protein
MVGSFSAEEDAIADAPYESHSQHLDENPGERSTLGSAGAISGDIDQGYRKSFNFSLNCNIPSRARGHILRIVLLSMSLYVRCRTL